MELLTYSTARASLKSVMDRAINDRTPVVVTRKNNEAVVVISLEDYNALQETMHLQRSPENAKRLGDSIAQLDAGQGIEKDVDL